MEIDRDTLAQNYADKSDAELLDLHISGTLTELAYQVLEEELSKRNITIPKRPPEEEEQQAIALDMLAKYYAERSDQELKELMVSCKHKDMTAKVIMEA